MDCISIAKALKPEPASHYLLKFFGVRILTDLQAKYKKVGQLQTLFNVSYKKRAGLPNSEGVTTAFSYNLEKRNTQQHHFNLTVKK